MKKIIGYFGIIVFITLIGILLTTCDTGGGRRNGGSLWAGSSEHQASISSIRSVVVDKDNFPYEKFSIYLRFLVGANTEGFGWTIISSQGANPYIDREKQIIPINGQIKVGDITKFLSENDEFCDAMIFEIFLLYEDAPLIFWGPDGYINLLAQFPTSMFVKGEIFNLYQRENPLREGWKAASVWDNKYPKLGKFGPDFAVFPFEGIDVTRSLDLKFEWDTSKLVDALIEVYNEKGSYNDIGDKNEKYFMDFFNSFSMKVIYRD